MMGHMIKFARISKNGFLGRFGTVRPNSSYIVPQLRAKNQENRWSRFPEIFDLPSFLGHFGPFWAVLGPLGPIPGKPDFSRKNGRARFLPS